MPPEAVRLHGALIQKVQPSVRSWVGQEARRVVMAGPQTPPDVAAVGAQVRSRFAGQRLGEMDIEALVMLVMTEAAAAAEQEIRETAAEIKKVNAEKKRLHEIRAAAEKQQRAALDDLLAKNDSLNALSSNRLQMLTDRHEKLIQALIDLLKKISHTQSTLIGNLK
jgi:hypothetical protein